MKRLGKILFSRYSICALIIGAELSMFVAILVIAESFGVLISLATLLSIAAIIHLVNREVNPEYKVSWAVVILLVPYAGVSLYALFFRRRLTRREIKLGKEISEALKPPEACSRFLCELEQTDALAAGKAKALLGDDSNAQLLSDTTSRYIWSGEEYFASLMADLRAAERSIFLEYFIIGEGVMWDSVHSVLKEKAEAGLDVRVIYDDIGCMDTLPRGYHKRLISEGIKCRVFGRITPKLTTVHNNRDHRKIAVIDSAVAYTGGVNIADEYIGERVRFGHWKDGGIRVEGAAAFGFCRQFLAHWAFISRDASEARLGPEAYRPVRTDGGYYLTFGQGPMPLYDSAAKNAFLNIINQARRYVFITTPYLIIDFDLTEALCCAAKRGVDVRIITPAIADKRAVKIMTKSSYPHLLRCGVKIFEYTPGFIHEKLLVSDDEYAVIGSINFDYRSLAHHFEDAVWIYSSPTVFDVKRGFLETESKSMEQSSKSAKLTLREWIVRIIIKLGAPLL